MPLTDVQLRRLKPRATPYKLSDGAGLHVIVQPTGAIWWRYNYRLHGRQKTISFGTYPDVALAIARDRLRAARELVAAGQDPAEAKRAERIRARFATLQTFEHVGREWFTRRSKTIAPRTVLKERFILENWIYPEIGGRSIGILEPPDILAMLRKIEAQGRYETTHRAKQIVGMVFRYALACGLVKRDQTADLRGALQPVVSTPRAALLEPTRIAGLLRAIDTLDGSPIVAIALQFAPLVFVRPGELRAAEWREVDLDGRLWRIPAAKMKMRDDHLVPLSTQAVALLRKVAPLTGGGRFVFPSVRTTARCISENTLNAALRRLGYRQDEMTAHGFRAMARTRLDETLRYPPEVIELQLAHRVPGVLGATYNRSRYLEQRAAMMQAWADYLDRLRTPGPA